jgi:mannose-1-phosphate guanylyltransferase
MKQAINVIIMAGGSGTRFWPLSRAQRPKQLLRLVGRQPMIVEAVEKALAIAERSRIWVITGKHLKGPIEAAVKKLLNPEQIIAEPCPRDTAGCIALSTALLARTDPQGTMAVMTADHCIGPTRKFASAVRAAAQIAAREDAIVIFGIRPTEPSPLYGYIECLGKHSPYRAQKVFDVKAFREKPDRKTAQKYLASGRFFWNSGMFVWTIPHIVQCFRDYMEKHYEFIQAAGGAGRIGSNIAAMFSDLPKISVDFGIMEKARRVKVIEANFHWDDVGSWLALEKHGRPDGQGNILMGESLNIASHNCIIYSEGAQLVATAGVKDLVIVATGDAVLVCHKSETARIKEIVSGLKERGRGDLL